MDDTAAGRHPVNGARLDALHRAHAVAVHHRPLVQIGDGGQANVGMGPHVVVGIRVGVDGAEVVEKDEGTDGLHGGRGQQAAHDKTAAQVFVVGFEVVGDAHGVILDVLSCVGQ